MKFEKFIKIYAGLFVALQIISIFYPSHYNWGIHFLAFHSKIIVIAAILFTLSLFSESFREKILSSTNTFLKNINRINFKPFPLLLVIFLFTIISLLTPVKLHLLGDGALLLREIANLWITEEIPPAFGHQYVIGLIINFIKDLFNIDSLKEAENFYRYSDYVIGIIFIVILSILMKHLRLKPIEKFLFGSMILLSPGIQLFIGYVENYALLYLSISAFIITGWLSFEKNLNFIIPVLIFLFAIGVHIGSIIFLPGILYLLYCKIGKNKTSLLVVSGLIFLPILIIIILFKREFIYALNQAILESRWSLLPISTTDNYFSYTMFSIYHFIDWLNANLLIVPFGLVISSSILFYRKQLNKKDHIFIFLSLTALFGLIFTFITHFALGMARDWDFMASFFVPIIFLNIYLLRKVNQFNILNNLLVLILGLSFIHTASWIGLNANENKSIKRISLLENNNFLGRISKLNYYETMGSYYYWKNEYIRAKEYFQKYYQVDSTNPRILGNMAAIYTKLNDRENTFRILKKAAEANSPNPGIYINLGVEYSRRGDTSRAIECYSKALRMDSTRSKAYANMASLFMNQKKYELAKENYLKALRLGLNEPVVFREIGFAYYYLKDYPNSLKYFELYLKFQPDDDNAKMMRDNLSLLIKYLEQNKK